MNPEQIHAYLVTDKTLSQAQIRAVVDGVKLGRIDSPVCITNRIAWRSLVIRMARIIISNRERIAELRHERDEALARNYELIRKLDEALAMQNDERVAALTAHRDALLDKTKAIREILERTP